MLKQNKLLFAGGFLYSNGFSWLFDLFSSDNLWPHTLSGGIKNGLFTLKIFP